MRKGKAYAQMRLKNPSALANIYASGKVTVCGARSEGELKRLLENLRGSSRRL